jgi:hypothetical protein
MSKYKREVDTVLIHLNLPADFGSSENICDVFFKFMLNYSIGYPEK